MADVIATVTTATEYVLSNGTKVASDVAVGFYTPAEILKIEIAGGILILAVLVITYAAYQAWNVRYHEWLRQKELEERIENGETPDPSEYERLSGGVNKSLLYITGILIMAAGAVLYIMP